MTRGLVIGKFYPPHSGHKYLIDQAQEHCDELDVLICDSPKYRISANTRQQWLQQIHPTAHIQIIPDIDHDDDSELWAEYTINFLGYKPDIVFSSEAYGEPYAMNMNAKHHMVDRERKTYPISGTNVRSKMLESWNFVESPVRKDIAIRIVVVGAESTGTTTLSKALAQHYQCQWAPEYGRLFSEAIQYSISEWTDQDFEHIAKVQQSMERALASRSNGMIICDTNATATQLWQQRYMGHITDTVHDIARKDIVTHYFLTGDEIPFVQDGIRDGEHIRHHMHQEFCQLLTAGDVPYTLLKGPPKERTRKAINIINTLLQEHTLHGKLTASRSI